MRLRKLSTSLRSLRSLGLVAVVAGALIASPGVASADDTAGLPEEATSVPQEELAPAEAALQEELAQDQEGDQQQPLSHGSCNSYRSFQVSSGYYIRVPSIGSGTTHCIMSRGSQSNGVLALQYSLNYCYGLSTGGLDAIYGPSTESAVATAQSREGTAADGIYGPNTRDAISWPVFPAGSWSPVGCAS